MENIYKNHSIEKNDFGYYEATDLSDCDAVIIFHKTMEGLKIEIDEKLINQ